MSVNRLRAISHYLRGVDSPLRWKLIKTACPNCAGRYFVALNRTPFMTRCLRCRANVTNLSLIPSIQHHSRLHSISRAWEMSTYGATLSFLRRQNINVQTSEYFPGAKPGERVDGVLNQDVQRTSFPDEYFDLVTSNQVFEHVQDDIAGYRECFRVLKSHGALIFSVPLHDLPETKQLAYHAEDRIVHITPP